MTTYYIYTSNAGTGIIAVCGNQAYELPTRNGVDGISGAQLYDKGIDYKQIACAYNHLKAEEELYSFDDILRDFGTAAVFDFRTTDYESLREIVEVG